MALVSVQQAIEDIKAGKFVIIVDDMERENEGDLAVAAEKVTPEIINFMSMHARGLICMPVIGKRLDELKIPLMVSDNTSRFTTAFTVSIEAKNGISTGISAADRATTVRTVIDPATRPEDVVRPGHIFPLRAKDGGVLVRAGHTEAIYDLARLGGLYPAGVICEILAEDGSMARLPQLEVMSEKFGINIVTVASLIAYRYRHEKLVQRVAEAKLPTVHGEFKAIAYKSDTAPGEHVALVMGDVTTDDPVLVRVHSECITGEVFGSLRCDCGDQVTLAMQAIAKEGRGVLLYMRQEGRGIGFHNKLRAYALQDKGLDTVEANLSLGFAADLRDYGIGAQILAELGLKSIRLLTNNPKKVIGLESYGLKVAEIVPIIAEPNQYNSHYLETKRKKMGHLFKAEGLRGKAQIDKERLMGKTFEGVLLGKGLKVAVVISRFNEFFGRKLLEGAQDALVRHGVSDDDIHIAWVPGSFEIPLIAQKLARTKRYDAIICLGAIIRGGTPHFEYISAEVTKGIAKVGMDTGLPVIYGVITTDTLEQAVERSGTKAGNRGFDAAMSAIEMANLTRSIAKTP